MNIKLKVKYLYNIRINDKNNSNIKLYSIFELLIIFDLFLILIL